MRASRLEEWTLNSARQRPSSRWKSISGKPFGKTRSKPVLDGNPNNFLLSATFNALLQASNLQQALSADTIELKSVKIELAATPTVTVQWKEKAVAKTAAAA